MRRLLSLFGIVHVVYCSCLAGFELVRNGECRGKYTKVHDRAVNFVNDAVSKCNEIHGTPIIIHNDEDQNYWSDKAISNGDSYYTVMGLRCNASSKWQWVDGSELDYKPPNHYPHFDESCTNGETGYIKKDGSWSYIEINDVTEASTPVYCTTLFQPPIPSPDGCDSFEDDSDDGICYQVGAIAENWQDAQMICQKLGANLASIHNAQENSFIRRLAVSKGAVNGVFLGATISGKGNDFGWVDGSAWDYDNFHQGFPMPGFGDCIAMDTSVSTGQWMNMDCTAKLPVACVREQRAAPTCSAGHKEDTIITSPGFPYNGSTFCDYFLTVESGKRVEVEIILLEANSCCDHLVIYDGYLGSSVIANLTGAIRNVTYSTTSSNMMRVNWQPNGGVNVMGMAMTYRAV